METVYIHIFELLKRAMSAKIAPLFMTKVPQIHEVEWLSAYIKTHDIHSII